MQGNLNHSSYSKTHRLVGIWLLTISVLMPLQGLAQVDSPNQAPRLAPGDVIQVSIPDRPSMNGELTLDAAGNVAIPQVGDVSLSGLTSAEAELVLRQWLRLFDPSIDQVEVFLQSGGADGLKFFVLGEVVRPGDVYFTEIPSFMDLMRAAGGPTSVSNLRQVRLIREVGSRTEVSELDLSVLFEGGETPEVELKPGDTLVVPALLAGVSAVPTATGVKVFGAVAVPTVVDIKGPTPMLDVLMLAGAPSADSEISEIYWVHHVGNMPEARVIDLREYLEEGNPVGNPLIYPGDTIRVDYYEEPWFLQALTFTLVTLAAVATIWLAYDRIVNE